MRNRLGLIIAVAWILLANAILLTKVIANRAGDSSQVITLTERELRLPRSWNVDELGEDIERQFLTFVWERNPPSPGGFSTVEDWFDREKLESLGFDCSVPPAGKEAYRHYFRQPPRDAYLVLEFNGNAWNHWLSAFLDSTTSSELLSTATDRAELPSNESTESENDTTEDRWYDDHDHPSWHLQFQTRLTPIDVGSDPEELRRRYPDAATYIVAAATVGASVSIPSDTSDSRSRRPYGRIIALAIPRVFVPKNFRASLARFAGEQRGSGSNPPRYTITLEYGGNHEPWIVDIHPIDTLAPSDRTTTSP